MMNWNSSQVVLRITPILLLGLLGVACDDGAPPEERVASIEVVSGNMQQGAVEMALPQPVVIRALDAQGNPVGGATVTWQAATGSGTIASSSTTAATDADGRASAMWMLGATAGAQSATATIGMASTTLAATATAGPAASVAVTPASVTLDAIGATAQLQITARDANDNPIEGRTPNWSSTDEGVVTVDAAGLVTAVSAGTATVQATLDGVTGEADIVVEPVPATIFLIPASPTLPAIGATVQLTATAQDRNGNEIPTTAQDFVWSSTNAAIVTVDATGLATAVAAGVAQVRATIGTVVGQAQVSVAQTPVTLTVAPKADTVTTAQPTAQLTVTGVDANGQPIVAPAVTWTSSNPLIATVSQMGLVTGISNGVARIRATSGTVVDSATITVAFNKAPVAVLDSIAAAIDMPLNLAAPGLLMNDTLGVPAGAITFFGGGTLPGGTTHAAGSTVPFGTGGSLRVNANGSIAFTPSAGFSGSFTFLYVLQNSIGSSTVFVTIEVGAAPTAADDSYATTVDVVLQITAPGILSNDNAGFPAAKVVSFGGGSLTGTTVTSFVPGQRVGFNVGGYIQVNADGSLTFTPPTGMTGTYTFQYRLSNGLGMDDGTITITVN